MNQKDTAHKIIFYPNLNYTSPIKKIVNWFLLYSRLRKDKYHQVLLLEQNVDSVSGKYISLLFTFTCAKSKHLLDPNGNQKPITSGKYLIKITKPFILRRIKLLAKIILIPMDILITGSIFLYLLINPRAGKVKDLQS